MQNKSSAEFNVDGLDRIIAILLYKGTFYVSDDNHQECLRQILIDEGTSYQEKYGLYCNGEDDIDAAAEITFKMQQTHNNDIIGFDVYCYNNSKYMVMYEKPDVSARFQQIVKFSEENGYVLAYYLSRDNKICKTIA